MIHGRNLIISDDQQLIAAAKSCEISASCETIETASPTDARARTFIAGRTEWSCTVSYLVVERFSEKLLSVGSTYNLAFTTDEDRLYGQAILTSCKITAAVGNLVQGSFAFQGSGELI